MMTRTMAALLTICIGTTALAETSAPASTPTTTGESTAETLKRLERDWADAIQTGDTEQVGRILGNDWIEVSNDGKKLTREQLLAGMKSGRVKVESIKLGPLDVKLLGDVAVVQGSHVEESAANGQQLSGEVVWMDVFANRDGKWVAVRSQSAARVKATSRPRWPI
ncbi:MAG: nuclear transport factor 2 family protein [Gammaproteobacteria bacterium]|nr:nuclear transport factor 2 family protein [Gammaproteobacteria bacterium]